MAHCQLFIGESMSNFYSDYMKYLSFNFRLTLLVFMAFSLCFSAQAQTEIPPKVVNLTEVYQGIKYPKGAVDEKIEGKVFLKVLVDQEGNYAKHEFGGKSDSRLQNAVADQIDKMQFEAGTKDGKAVNTWITIPINFKLPEK